MLESWKAPATLNDVLEELPVVSLPSATLVSAAVITAASLLPLIVIVIDSVVPSSAVIVIVSVMAVKPVLSAFTVALVLSNV